MAGGDLLYIFAFIILPTAVLVSCIWALILLRNGALLPDRRVRARDGDISQLIDTEDDVAPAESDRGNLVEETGEHAIVGPSVVAAAPIARTPDAPEPVATQAVTAAPPLPPRADATRATDEPPPAERTEELDVVPMREPPDSDEHDSVLVVAPPIAQAPMVDDSDPDADAVRAAPAATEAASVLMVPLDDSPETVRAAAGAPGSSNGSDSSATDAVQLERDDALPDAVPASSSRRPVRRVAQLRSSEDAASRPRPRAGQRQSARRRDGDA